MATQEFSLSGDFADASTALSLTADVSYLLECGVCPMPNIARKRPSAHWLLASSAPAASAAAHALFSSDWKRGGQFVSLKIPAGESLWIRGDNRSGASVLVTKVG